MTDMSKLSRLHKRLGAPPAPASRNLAAPELAPGPERGAAPGRVDGRSLRKTGRTIQFATRITADLDAEIKHFAQRDGLKIVEVLERAIALYGKKSRS